MFQIIKTFHRKAQRHNEIKFVKNIALRLCVSVVIYTFLNL